MKYTLLFAALFTLSTAAFGQKQDVRLEEDLVTVDGAEYARIERDGCGALSPECAWYFKSLAGKKLLTVKLLTFTDPSERSQANPKGMVAYFQYTFSGSDAKTETISVGLGNRDLKVAKRIVKAGLIKGDTLDGDAVADFIAENGTPYSDRRKNIGGPDVIIINNRN